LLANEIHQIDYIYKDTTNHKLFLKFK
jgi:hypothetical protein